jgi:ABC-2 type transport system ATP-binding protein
MNTLIEKWLKKVGLWERRNENIKHFSGGMQRRVTFVRSVLHNPNILFFDEPTTGLDIQTRIEMWKWIKELKDLGKLVFLTTHYIEEAEKLCDEVIIIDHGKVLDQDSPSNCRDKYVSKAIMELSSSASLEILQKSLPNYKISEVTNESFIIRMNKLSDANTILDSLTNQNIDFTNFSSKETTLEEAFIELTGRRIRS